MAHDSEIVRAEEKPQVGQRRAQPKTSISHQPTDQSKLYDKGVIVSGVSNHSRAIKMETIALNHDFGFYKNT